MGQYPLSFGFDEPTLGFHSVFTTTEIGFPRIEIQSSRPDIWFLSTFHSLLTSQYSVFIRSLKPPNSPPPEKVCGFHDLTFGSYSVLIRFCRPNIRFSFGSDDLISGLHPVSQIAEFGSPRTSIRLSRPNIRFLFSFHSVVTSQHSVIIRFPKPQNRLTKNEYLVFTT
jgi:hypothetical protein